VSSAASAHWLFAEPPSTRDAVKRNKNGYIMDYQVVEICIKGFAPPVSISYIPY